MESKIQQKLAHSSSGHENHGVHVCHKCGWPFPNPHPSAKHRRAHKKVCGTIEGYKSSVDLEGTSHSNVSVDEQISDEDHKIPSPKVLEPSGSEKGSVGAGELPSRSVDEVFSDAAAEFVELAINVEKVSENEPTAIHSVDRAPVAETVKPPVTTTDEIQVQDSENRESRNDIVTNGPEFPGSGASHVSDGRTECSDLLVHSDGIASADYSNPFESETQKDPELESNTAEATDGAFDSSTLAQLVEEKIETCSNNTSLDVKISQIEESDETSIEPKLEKLPEVESLVCTEIPGTDFPAEVDDPKITVKDLNGHKVPDLPQSDEIKGLVIEESGRSNQCKDEEEADPPRISENRGSDQAEANQAARIASDSADLVGDDDHDTALNSALSGDYKSEEPIEGDREAEKDDATVNACHAAIGLVKGESGVENSEDPTEESLVENVVVNPAADSKEGGSGHHEKGIIEKGAEFGTGTEEDQPLQKITASESAGHTRESQTIPDTDKVIESEQAMRSSNSVDDHSKDETLPAKESDAASGLGSESFQGESDQQQLAGSVVDLSVDSSSQTDSLENNWGSVSVLSIQSDAQPVTDAETLAPTGSRAVPPGKIAKPAEKSDMFEAPSFMTLVEPRGENGRESNGSEIQTTQNPQQAGWFPSVSHVPTESQGRKKNEEIIAKVTNWSAGKQHTPLKSLLGEARVKSPRADKPATTTVNSILAPESPAAKTGKEWDSPARYPTEIKREKRKPKSRPYWAQFMCCSSVH